MLCPRCHGTHFVLVSGQRLPCPECAGVGEIHCCDGLTEQPDASADETSPDPAEECRGLPRRDPLPPDGE